MSLLVYCVKCREHTDSSDLKAVVMKNGKDAMSSTCAACGTRKFRIGKLPTEAVA